MRKRALLLYALALLGIGIIMFGVTRKQNLSYDGVPYFYGSVIKAKHNPHAVYLETPPLLFLYVGFFVNAEQFQLDYCPRHFRLRQHNLVKNIFAREDLQRFQRQNAHILAAEGCKAKLAMVLYALIGFCGVALTINVMTQDRLFNYLLFLLYITQPAILSLSNLVMADLLLVSNYIFAIYLLILFYHRQNWLIIAGLSVVAALLAISKYTGLPMIVGIIVSVMLGTKSRRKIFYYILPLILVPLVVVNGSYLFCWYEFPHYSLHKPLVEAFGDNMFTTIIAQIFAFLPLPDSYLIGIIKFGDHSLQGHKAFLLGENYRLGKWYFFPISIALKMTFICTFLIIVSLVFLLRKILHGDWKKGSSCYLRIFAPPVLLLLMAMNARVNDGLRNAVWIVIFLLLTIAVRYVLASKLWKKTLLALVTMGVVYNIILLAMYYPGYVAFIDPIFGGPQKTNFYLGGSNIDMGENFYMAEKYLQKQNVKRVINFYFGHAIPLNSQKLTWLGRPRAVIVHPDDRILISEALKCYERDLYDKIYRYFEKEVQIAYNISIFYAIPKALRHKQKKTYRRIGIRFD